MVIREKKNVLQCRTQALQSMQKSMDQMNIRLHHAVSDIDGVTGMRILEAIISGERDPAALAELRDPRCKKSAGVIAAELMGNWREERLFNLRQSFERLKFLDGQVASYDAMIREMYAGLAAESDRPDPPDDGRQGRKAKDATDRGAKRDLARPAGFDPTKIDGIGYASAAAIISELGADLSMFPTESHFVSYVGLAPPLAKSAGKNLRTRGKHKNTHPVGQIFKEAATTLWRSQSALGALYRSVKSRTCSTFATMATARQMAKMFYRGMKYGQAYVDIGAQAYEQRHRERTIKSMKSKISNLGIRPEELGFAKLVG